jgi:Zn-dependent protease with chaperone function
MSTLLVLLTLVAAPPGSSTGSLDETTLVAVPAPSARAIAYDRGNFYLWFVNEAWAIGLPTVLLCTRVSARIRNVSRRIGRVWLLEVGLFAVLYLAVTALINLPLAYYEGFLREHAYGLSNQSLGRWLGNRVKGLGVSMLLWSLLLWVPYFLLRRSPRSWWILLGLLIVPFLFASAYLKPVAFDPLFHHFGPMSDKKLEREVLSLAARAGISRSRVYEVDMSRDTNAANAYVTGVLETKRIVLWDTLLSRLDDREVLTVLAHELGHYQLGHVASGLLISALLTTLGLGVVHLWASAVLRISGGRFGFDRLYDVASLPLLLALSHVVFLGLSPLGYAYSRSMEHEADRFALELTRMNHSCATALVKLQRENLGVPWHDRFTQIWRSTHPSLGERIEFSNSYRPWLSGKPLKYASLLKPRSMAPAQSRLDGEPQEAR